MGWIASVCVDGFKVDAFVNDWQIIRRSQCDLTCLSEGPELDNAQPRFKSRLTVNIDHRCDDSFAVCTPDLMRHFALDSRFVSAVVCGAPMLTGRRCCCRSTERMVAKFTKVRFTKPCKEIRYMAVCKSLLTRYGRIREVCCSREFLYRRQQNGIALRPMAWSVVSS